MRSLLSPAVLWCLCACQTTTGTSPPPPAPGSSGVAAAPAAEAAAEDARRLGLVIVDACRNAPFVERLPGVNRSMSRVLAGVEPSGRDRLVAFAAWEGTVARDGDGENSPRATALIEALSAPGLEIGTLFRRVRDPVLDATGGQQEPAVYG